MITKHSIFATENFFCPQFCGHQTEVNILVMYLLLSLLMYLVGLNTRYMTIHLVLWTSD